MRLGGCCRRSWSGGAIDKIAEDKIARWLREGGNEQLSSSSKKGKPLNSDPHGHLSRSMGVFHDYVHSKILADNNIKPKSIELRLELDRQWDDLKREIQIAYRDSRLYSIADFLRHESCQSFRSKFETLNEFVQQVNASIIEDSMRFHGRSPVRHAKKFEYESRIQEALQDVAESNQM
jgi:hypothetical protein